MIATLQEASVRPQVMCICGTRRPCFFSFIFLKLDLKYKLWRLGFKCVLESYSHVTSTSDARDWLRISRDQLRMSHDWLQVSHVTVQRLQAQEVALSNVHKSTNFSTNKKNKKQTNKKTRKKKQTCHHMSHSTSFRRKTSNNCFPMYGPTKPLN